MTRDVPPTILGSVRQRSFQNADDVDQLFRAQQKIEQRLDKVERYALFQAVTLAVLAAQALGVPTQNLLTYLLTIL
jgi:hypothetical protein